MDAKENVAHGLEVVRLARGLTQAQLAKAASLPQTAVSKAESGESVSQERLLSLSSALDCRPELLLSRAVPMSTAACVFHRKRANTTIGQAKQARAWLALTRLHAEALLGLVGGPALALARQAPTDDDYVTPEDVAGEVRAGLGLPPGPVPCLVAALEAAGVVVSDRVIEGGRIDALSDWLPGHRPVFLINRTSPGERQRFTLAHETGHVVMHDFVTERAESQADRFAAELLMPAAVIREELERPSLERLLALKRRWGVSAAALARRAHDLGIASESSYRRLNMEMSAAGWRRAEPLPLEPERPLALASARRRAVEEFGAEETARRVLLPQDQLTRTFQAGDADD